MTGRRPSPQLRRSLSSSPAPKRARPNSADAQDVLDFSSTRHDRGRRAPAAAYMIRHGGSQEDGYLAANGAFPALATEEQSQENGGSALVEQTDGLAADRSLGPGDDAASAARSLLCKEFETRLDKLNRTKDSIIAAAQMAVEAGNVLRHCMLVS